jgi:hypothetical protein
MTRRHVAHRCKPPRDTQPASALPGNRPCGATLNSLISGVSRISRNRCKGSTETLSGITRNRNVKHQPRSYTFKVGAGLEPATNGL